MCVTTTIFKNYLSMSKGTICNVIDLIIYYSLKTISSVSISFKTETVTLQNLHFSEFILHITALTTFLRRMNFSRRVKTISNICTISMLLCKTSQMFIHKHLTIFNYAKFGI